MTEFRNRNLEKTEPDYFYRVWVFMTTFGMDEGKNDSFAHTEDFKGDDLLQCKERAKNYYYERLIGMEGGSYFLPFHGPENFIYGKHASFSVVLSLVEYYGEDNEIEHPLLGEDDETIAESREIEEAVLREKTHGVRP